MAGIVAQRALFSSSALTALCFPDLKIRFACPCGILVSRAECVVHRWQEEYRQEGDSFKGGSAKPVADISVEIGSSTWRSE